LLGSAAPLPTREDVPAVTATDALPLREDLSHATVAAP